MHSGNTSDQKGTRQLSLCLYLLGAALLKYTWQPLATVVGLRWKPRLGANDLGRQTSR